ncbi:MAG: DUF2461 domain-containing protein [Bacteroidota bacterium]
MLQPSTLNFLKSLNENNNREWFEKNRDTYETAKNDFNNWTEQLIKVAQKISDDYHHLQLKDCIFRIYRDVRFSKNKAPYKNHMALQLKKNGKKSPYCGFYIHIEPSSNASFIAGGFWMPEVEVLKKVRQEIEYNTDDFKKIIHDKKFKSLFGTLEEHKLKKAPKGVDPSHPDIELLKYTSYVVTSSIDNSDLTSDNLTKQIIKGLKTIQPFLDFLNTAIE